MPLVFAYAYMYKRSGFWRNSPYVYILGHGVKVSKLFTNFDYRSQYIRDILGNGVKVTKLFINFDYRSQYIRDIGTWSQCFLST